MNTSSSDNRSASTNSTPINKRSSRRRNLSCPDFLPSPTNQTTGVPFKWEHQPGIPKSQTPPPRLTMTSSGSNLPLPPAAGTKIHINAGVATMTEADPFLMALLECSKDEEDHDNDGDHQQGCVWKHGKTMSRRSMSQNKLAGMLLNLITGQLSCRRSCQVSQATAAFLPTFRRLT